MALGRLGVHRPVATREYMPQVYDALIVVSFGGPEHRDDVMPFLDNVLRGKPVPPERKREVAEHYLHFGGRSPINDQVRALLHALGTALPKAGIELPLYWGNRNWHPMLGDTVGRMQQDGVRRALALVTSAFSSYSGCRQYRENIAEACAAAGESAPQIDKIRAYFNHPGFIGVNSARLGDTLRQAALGPSDHPVVFTAHSIPLAMAKHCDYEAQLLECAELVAQEAGIDRWSLAYQSRSGPPQMPWLEPDICDHLSWLKSQGEQGAVLHPLGFVSDHMEVIWDLDHEAREHAQGLGLAFYRVPTPGVHPHFVDTLVDLVRERVEGRPPLSIGDLPAKPHFCEPDCCLYPKPHR